MTKVAYDPESRTLVVPVVKGVNYFLNGEPFSGTITLEETSVVTAEPAKGFRFPKDAETRWQFEVEEAEDEVDEVGELDNPN